MKRLLLFVSMGVLAFGLAACGGKDDAGQGTGSSPSSVESSSSAENSAAPESTDENGGIDEDLPDDGGFSGGEEESWSVEMQGIRDAVAQELGDNYWPSMPVSADMLEGIYGVTTDLCDDYMGEVPMMSAHVDALLVVKAKDGQEETVETALNAYRDRMVSDTMQYPMNMGKIQASKVERIGNYVCFVQLGGDTMEVEGDGDEAVILHCQEQNDRAIEAIAAAIGQ